jgi:hypothetical protein
MKWIEGTDPLLVAYFERENAFAKKWTRIRGADVEIALSRGGTYLFAVYEATFKGSAKRFAHSEVSAGVNVFCIPAP